MWKTSPFWSEPLNDNAEVNVERNSHVFSNEWPLLSLWQRVEMEMTVCGAKDSMLTLHWGRYPTLRSRDGRDWSIGPSGNYEECRLYRELVYVAHEIRTQEKRKIYTSNCAHHRPVQSCSYYIKRKHQWSLQDELATWFWGIVHSGHLTRLPRIRNAWNKINFSFGLLKTDTLIQLRKHPTQPGKVRDHPEARPEIFYICPFWLAVLKSRPSLLDHWYSSLFIHLSALLSHFSIHHYTNVLKIGHFSMTQFKRRIFERN